MYQVMIVEDSIPIARNIKQHVESANRHLRVTAIAHNGLEALDKLRQHPIDLVITDIRMPRMDGLTFIQEAKAIRPDLKFLILSGYSDFEYARQAIRLGVSEYLLKPPDQQELSATLDRMVQELYAANRDKLARDIADYIALGEADEAIAWPDHWTAYRLLVVRIGYFKFGNVMVDREILDRLCREHLPGAECISASSPGDSEKVILCTWTEEPADLDAMMLSFHQALQSVYLLPYLAYSPKTAAKEQIIPLYRRLTHHLDLSVKPGISQHWFVDTKNESDKNESDSFEELAKTKCLTFIHNNRQKALQEELDQLTAYWEKQQATVFRIKTCLYDIFSQAYPAFHHDMVDVLIASCMSFRDIGKKVMEEFVAVMDQEEPKSELIHAIDRLFEANLHRQLSMQEMCHSLNYSATYIIRIVKQYRGMTPIEYFNKLKIDKARELLDASDNIMIKDIADALGFSNQHYFSKVFKQYTGCNPSEYKERAESKE